MIRSLWTKAAFGKHHQIVFDDVFDVHVKLLRPTTQSSAVKSGAEDAIKPDLFVTQLRYSFGNISLQLENVSNTIVQILQNRQMWSTCQITDTIIIFKQP